MQQGQHNAQAGADRECKQCGHAERYHESAREAGIDEAQQKTVCTSPEDGQPCTCERFAPV